MKKYKEIIIVISVVVIAIFVIVGWIAIQAENNKPSKLISNTPTNLSLGGIFTITAPCLAGTPYKLPNSGGYDPTEYSAQCTTNEPNSPSLDYSGTTDSYSGLPPMISYEFTSYSSDQGQDGINVPSPKICQGGGSFDQTINGVQFTICGATNKSVGISAIAINGDLEADIQIMPGVGNGYLPSTALRSLDNTLSSFQFINN